MAGEYNYQEQTQAPFPYWTEAQNRMLGQGEQLYNQQRWGTVPQQGVAGLTPDQQAAFELARSSAGSWQPALDQSQQFLTQAGQGAQFDPNQVQQYLNPYLSGVIGEIGRLGQQGFQETVAPSIARQFGGLGQYGSARQAMALAEAGGRQQRETLGQQATALKGAYDTAMQGYKDWTQMGIGAKQAAGIGLGNLGQQMQGLYTGDIANLSTAGATQQKQQQDILNSQFQQWQQQQQYPWQALNQWADLFKTGMPQTSTSWNTGFKKGGLARYADGGRFRDPSAFDMTYQHVIDKYPELKEDKRFRDALYATAMKESGGRADVRGPKLEKGMHVGDQAVGLYQLMPKTALGLGVSDITDLDAMNRAGAEYFANNYLDFGGNPYLAAIAHHAGPGAARRAQRTGEAPETKDLATGLSTTKYARDVASGVGSPVTEAPSESVPEKPITLPNLNQEREAALAARRALLQKAVESPELQAVPERSEIGKIGEALLRASAEGPANIGQFIGRTGKSYFDEEAELSAENKKRALERLTLEEKMLPELPEGINWSIQELNDGSLVAVNPKDPTQQIQVRGPTAKGEKYSTTINPATGDVIRTGETSGAVDVAIPGAGFRVPPEYKVDPSDPTKVVPLPGTKAEREQQEAKFKGEEQVLEIEKAADIADELIKHGGRETVTGWQQNIPFIKPQDISGSAAADYAARLDTFKALGWLTQAQKVRGLGQLTEAEGKKLENAFETLQITQSDIAHKKALENIKSVLSAQASRIRGAKGSGEVPSSPDETGDEDTGSIYSKYGL